MTVEEIDYPCEKSKDGRHHFIRDGTGYIYCGHCNKSDEEIKDIKKSEEDKP